MPRAFRTIRDCVKITKGYPCQSLGTIPVLEYIKETWGNMANHPKFSEVEISIHKGIENLDELYDKVNDTVMSS